MLLVSPRNQSPLLELLAARFNLFHAYARNFDGRHTLKVTATERPWISNVASILLDEDPQRWEKDKRQLEHVQNLGAGEFGQVVKMSTRLFSSDGSKGFVAVKMLTSAPKGDADGAGAAAAAAAGIDGNAIVQGSSLYHDNGIDGSAIAQGSGMYHALEEKGSDDADGAASSLEVDFLREATLMKQFRHPNLVQLLGVCTATKPYMMILEFLTGGSLDQWLPANGPMLLKPTASKLVHLLHQVALGMTELGKASIVHRDLAARNVLIDEKLHVKVADYGLSRDVDEDKNYYRIHTERPIPLRWTAPEAVTVLKFTSASDVFAFGVLAFEIFTFGCFPFDAIADDSQYLELLTGTIGGQKVETQLEALHRPLALQIKAVLVKHGVQAGAPPPLISTLLEDCLYRDPLQRPTFAELVQRTRIGSAQKC